MNVPFLPFSTCVGVLVLDVGPDQFSYLLAIGNKRHMHSPLPLLKKHIHLYG
jgi:hypothetical protein